MKLIKSSNILFLMFCLYPCVCFSQEIVLSNNMNAIELVFKIKDYKEVPEEDRKKIILKKKKKKCFLKDISKLQPMSGNSIFVFCNEVRFYRNNDVVLSLETNGYIFYDRANNLFYQSEENLLEKYWGLTEENTCR